MNTIKHIFVFAVFLLAAYLTLATCGSSPAQDGGSSQSPSGSSSSPSGAESTSPYWTGDGAKGDSIAILPLADQGLSEAEKQIPVTVQGILVDDMDKFSAMRVVDRLNLEKIIAEGESGYYADENNFAQLGQQADVKYIMNGSIQKTGSGFQLQLRVSEAADGTTRAGYTGNCRLEELEDQSAIKKASDELLSRLGVNLTAAGRQALMAPVADARKQADNALARGIVAQRQGTEVTALTYYFQAAAYDPSLLEAANRSSILNADISSGNIGQNVRNDIAWRDSWVARLTETEQLFAEFNKTQSMPYTLFYKEDIKQLGEVNYQNRTVVLSIEANLHPGHTWGRTVGVPMQQALRAVYNGLQATQRASVWGLGGWPSSGVTNLNAFAGQRSSFAIDAELLNDRNQVIGRQSFWADGSWGYAYDGYAPSGIRISDDVQRTVNFTVKADDISDRLTIRIATVNGVAAETAARNGVLQVRAMAKAEYDRNVGLGSVYNFALGEIRGYRGNDTEVIVTIPDAIWGETVASIRGTGFSGKHIYIPSSITSISEGAFSGSGLIGVTIPSSVTSIGDSAFANNQLTSIAVPGSVLSIGDHAFDGNPLTNVNIADGVKQIGEKAIKMQYSPVFRKNAKGIDIGRAILPGFSITIGAGVNFVNFQERRFNDAFAVAARANDAIAARYARAEAAGLNQKDANSFYTDQSSGQYRITDGNITQSASYNFTFRHSDINPFRFNFVFLTASNLFGFTDFYNQNGKKAGKYTYAPHGIASGYGYEYQWYYNP